MLIVIRLRIIPKVKNQMLKILERTQQRLMADFMMVLVVHQILDHLVKMPEVRHLPVTICLVICQPEVIQVILAWSLLLFKRWKICLKAQLRTQKRKTEIQTLLLKASLKQTNKYHFKYNYVILLRNAHYVTQPSTKSNNWFQLEYSLFWLVRRLD